MSETVRRCRGLQPGSVGSLSLGTNSFSVGGGVDFGVTCLVSLASSCSSANRSESYLVFKASPKAWQAKHSSMPTPPPIQVGTLVTQQVSSGCPKRWVDFFPKRLAPPRPHSPL